MKIKQWANNLGFDITVKGRTWQCGEANGKWHAKLVHSGTYHKDREGSGHTWMHAIANAKNPN